ncbi:hypothetical protein BASA81_014833 [Batrachochytrium salamandrivorans]|nr:hypothetical protein BASA81_014833 [Batrachochytrium salamandrivorans]
MDPVKFLIDNRKKYGDCFTFLMLGRKMTFCLGPDETISCSISPSQMLRLKLRFHAAEKVCQGCIQRHIVPQIRERYLGRDECIL